MRYIFIIFVLLTIKIEQAHTQIVINEICANNNSILMDEEKKYPDWIELYNTSDKPVDLTDWQLTDKVDSTTWKFPEVRMMPHSYLLVFASGKETKNYFHHWETIVKAEEEWKYFVPEEPIDQRWLYPNYPANEFKTGKGGFGFGDGDDNTIVKTDHSVCIRKTFTIENIQDIARYALHIDYDDAFVAYLNGREIARRNIGRRGKYPAFDAEPKKAMSAKLFQDKTPRNVLYRDSIFRATIKEGDNLIAIQTFNYGVNSSDMSILPYLSTAVKNNSTDYPKPPEWWVFPNSTLHCTFKLKKGETLTLQNEKGKIVDQFEVAKTHLDHSWGRAKDGNKTWHIFDTPTPNASNNTQKGYPCYTPKPKITPTSGFYDKEISLEVEENDLLKKAKIHYTLDGSLPTTSSPIFKKNLVIDTTRVVRIQAFTNECLTSSENTYTYFIDDHPTLPVVSLVSEPDNFFSDEKGIYVEGPDAEPKHPKKGANYWEEWEIPVEFEYFDLEGKKVVKQKVGVQINGGGSRTKAMKSLRVCARGQYGKKTLNAPFFEERTNTKFKRILLKNGGQSFGKPHIVDALMHRIVSDLGTINTQAFQPAVVYINGEYWGVHNIREKLSEHYLIENHDLNPDSIAMLGGSGTVRIEGKGHQKEFKKWADEIKESDLSDPVLYQKFTDYWNVENFCDYFITQIYLLNVDWTRVGNVKFWRHPDHNNNKWEYFLCDTDLTMARRTSLDKNHLNFVMTDNYLHFKILRAALKNEGFKSYFLMRYLDLLNTTYAPQNVIAHIDSMTAQIAPEMPRHSKRWKLKFEKWEGKYIAELKEFALERPDYAIEYLKDTFFLQEPLSVELGMAPINGGKVHINTITIEEFPFIGKYWQEQDINVTAEPAPGYVFSHWIVGKEHHKEDTYIFKPKANMLLKAVFKRE